MNTTLSTTHNFHSLKLIIFKNNILFQNSPMVLSETEVLVFLKDSKGEEINKQFYPKHTKIAYKIPISLPPGVYSFNVYIKNNLSNIFWSYHKEDDILLNFSSDRVGFYSSPVRLTNSIRASLFPKDSIDISKCLCSSRTIQSDSFLIKETAKNIIKGKTLNYVKVLAIHDWIAENIYYDNDALADGSYMRNDNSALATLNMRKNVCQGYANLTVAMLRAIHIPSFVLSCFALGESTLGGWNTNNNLKQDANHVIAAAYVDNRWIIMDTTWDSDNYIENGIKKQKTGLGVLHRYFDSTLSFLSSTHRLERQWDQ